MSVHNFLLVAGGGAAGAMARYAANMLCTEIMGRGFPWGTLVVNVLGCFALGWLVQLAGLLSHSWLLVLATGFLGSFTTYSAFGVETIQAWNRMPLIAVLNVAGHLVLGLFSVRIGIYLATRVHGL